jgi:hypothetical protein
VSLAPEHDAPDCPNRCGGGINGLATPIAAAEVERWDGPEEATLFCPMCGAGWVGSAADVELAAKSWSAYEAEVRLENGDFNGAR